MSLSVVLRDEAQTEFDEAFDWYNNQQDGLGSEFVAELQQVFDRIAANPKIHRIVFADIRRAVVHRFPFCVMYRPHAEHLEVIAIFHTSRDPAIWQNRV